MCLQILPRRPAELVAPDRLHERVAHKITSPPAARTSTILADYLYRSSCPMHFAPLTTSPIAQHHIVPAGGGGACSLGTFWGVLRPTHRPSAAAQLQATENGRKSPKHARESKLNLERRHIGHVYVALLTMRFRLIEARRCLESRPSAARFGLQV